MRIIRDYTYVTPEDRGASEEEIAAITEPMGEVKFKATGVKILIPSEE